MAIASARPPKTKVRIIPIAIIIFVIESVDSQAITVAYSASVQSVIIVFVVETLIFNSLYFYTIEMCE
jgi:hypothetical protein